MYHKPYTCCAHVTVPEQCCQEEKPLLSLQSLDCSQYDLSGSYIRFTAGYVFATGAYIQLGNYNSKLFLEHFSFGERIEISKWTYPTSTLNFNDFWASKEEFKPPGWVLATVNTYKHYTPSTIHLAFNNNKPLSSSYSSCPPISSGNESESQEWKCYKDIPVQPGWLYIHDVAGYVNNNSSYAVAMKCTAI